MDDVQATADFRVIFLSLSAPSLMAEGHVYERESIDFFLPNDVYIHALFSRPSVPDNFIYTCRLFFAGNVIFTRALSGRALYIAPYTHSTFCSAREISRYIYSLTEWPNTTRRIFAPSVFPRILSDSIFPLTLRLLSTRSVIFEERERELIAREKSDKNRRSLQIVETLLRELNKPREEARRIFY